jgi:hypothetical protein
MLLLWIPWRKTLWGSLGTKPLSPSSPSFISRRSSNVSFSPSSSSLIERDLNSSKPISSLNTNLPSFSLLVGPSPIVLSDQFDDPCSVKDIYSWSRLTPLEAVKVVVLGQVGPILSRCMQLHGISRIRTTAWVRLMVRPPRKTNKKINFYTPVYKGLSFSVLPPTKLPGSLKNIYKQIAIDFPTFTPPKDKGHVTFKSFVLALNVSLQGSRSPRQGGSPLAEFRPYGPRAQCQLTPETRLGRIHSRCASRRHAERRRAWSSVHGVGPPCAKDACDAGS